MSWYEESLYTNWQNGGYAQRFRIDRVLFEERSEHQSVIVFETPLFGRVLAIDGIIQTTERDEHAYHEMMSHVPILAHGGVSSVLIVGGGDGGILREVLRHPSVKTAHMVEIDRMVVDICAEHMPGLSAGAFDDPRATLVIADGCKFVQETDARYDVVIVDSTDPVGPGEVLFTQEFYADCRRCMNPGGIIVTQSGVPFAQPQELTTTVRRLGSVFGDASAFLTSVPTYVMGPMALGWGSDEAAHRTIAEEDLTRRFAALGISTRYYTPGVHKAAFNLPAFMRELID